MTSSTTGAWQCFTGPSLPRCCGSPAAKPEMPGDSARTSAPSSAALGPAPNGAPTGAHRSPSRRCAQEGKAHNHHKTRIFDHQTLAHARTSLTHPAPTDKGGWTLDGGEVRGGGKGDTVGLHENQLLSKDLSTTRTPQRSMVNQKRMSSPKTLTSPAAGENDRDSKG